MYSMTLLFYFLGIIALAVSPWILCYWAYEDENDWRWRCPINFGNWLLENKQFTWLSTAISVIAIMGLMVHP